MLNGRSKGASPPDFVFLLLSSYYDSAFREVRLLKQSYGTIVLEIVRCGIARVFLIVSGPHGTASLL